MKRITTKFLSVLILVAAMFTNVNAQDYYKNKHKKSSDLDDKNLKLGLAVSPNVGWFRYNDSDYENSSKLGLSYGLLADIGFTENYYFSTGLFINSISSSLKSNIIEDRESIRLQYLDIPLTIKLKSVENELGRFYGQFGFTAGLKVSGKEQIVGSNRKTSIAKDDLFRLGLQIGGGAEWKLNDNLALLTGLSFNNGFTRAINNSGKPRTSYVALNIGILF